MKFEKYIRAASSEECVQILSDYGADAKILAGGTDLIPQMRNGSLHVKVLIDLTRVPEFCCLKKKGEGFFIGTAFRLARLQKCDELTGALSVLCQCAGHVSSMQVRNVATLGGNVCNASPAADVVPGLLLLDAEAKIRGIAGERMLPVAKLLQGPGKTALNDDEIVEGFLIKKQASKTGAAYCKYAIRGDCDIAIVGVGGLLTLDASGKIARARLALSGVGPTAVVPNEAQSLLEGQTPCEGLFREAAELSANASSPITDHRATAHYRLEMVKLWVQEALKQAHQRAICS